MPALSLPLPGDFGTYPITPGQDFGPSQNVNEPRLYGYDHFHTGVDFSAGCGVNILAQGTGVVTKADGGWNTGYGNCTIIDYGGGVSALYAHQTVIYVTVGATVHRGDIIGTVGTTGNSFGCHLHYSILLNGRYVRPQDYLDGGVTVPGTIARPDPNAPTLTGVDAARGSDMTGTGGSDIVFSSPNSDDITAEQEAAALDALAPIVPDPPETIVTIARGIYPGRLAYTKGDPVALLWIPDYWLPVSAASCTITSYHNPGSYDATVSFDWLTRQNNNEIVNVIKKKGKTQCFLFMGYVPNIKTLDPSTLTPMFTGLLEGSSFNLDRGPRTLEMRGPDLSGLMSSPSAATPGLQSFTNMTPNQIAIQIAKAHNLNIQTGPDVQVVTTGLLTPQGQTTQVSNNQTEWEVLTTLAGKYGLACYMDGTTLVFAPLSAATPPTLHIDFTGDNLIDKFKVTYQPHSKREYRVNVKSYDSKSGATAAATNDSPGVTNALAIAGNRNAVQVITVTAPPNTLQPELQIIAAQTFQRYQATEILLDVTFSAAVPIDRFAPVVFDNVPLEDIDGVPFYPSKITYNYTRSTGVQSQGGISMQVTLTSQPFGVVSPRGVTVIGTS